MGTLPDFVPPMLAKLRRRPFDSPSHLFEPKWDGFRVQVGWSRGAVTVKSRRNRDLTLAFPECGAARTLPEDTLLDGELVVLRNARPDFEAMLRRGQARGERTAARLAAELPATLVVFDLLYERGSSCLDLPLAERRARLADLLQALPGPGIVLSQGSVGGGELLFEHALEHGFEGIVAKRLDSAYLPGQRSDLWTKVKLEQRRLCIVLGFLRDSGGALKSLIVGSDVGGELRCVGRVGSGLTDADRARLLALLEARRAPRPLVDCGPDGEWVEPGVYCTVRFLELTTSGSLRAPVFEGLVEEG